MRLFDEVSELVLALTPEQLGEVHVRSHHRGAKVWFGAAAPPKEHYEAQVLPRRHVDGVEGMALEIGFHSEYPEVERNNAVLARVLEHEERWRKVLGPETEAADFFGAPHWRRVSEAWIEPDLDDPDLAFEVASRLVDYVTVIEPARS